MKGLKIGIVGLSFGLLGICIGLNNFFSLILGVLSVVVAIGAFFVNND